MWNWSTIKKELLRELAYEPLRQMLYLAIGGMVSLLAYILSVQAELWWLWAYLVGVSVFVAWCWR
jgi:hypothetical protein